MDSDENREEMNEFIEERDTGIRRIAQGAEAVLFANEGRVLKHRLAKSYRHPELDMLLRKSRTRKEARIIEKIQSLKFPSPKLFAMCDRDMKIEMEFVQGALLKNVLESNHCAFGAEIGKNIAQLHANNIVHGDLTTSNMILAEKDRRIHFIDFGLSFVSDREEDKAVDLHLLRKALESKHHSISEECLAEIHRAYQENYGGAGTVFERLRKVEARGRHKSKSFG